MSKLPAIQFYGGDWMKDPELRSVSYAARGLWIDMLCLMSECDPRGYLRVNGKPPTLDQLARMTGGSTEEVSPLLAELESAGVFSKTRHNVIYSRRMVRDQEIREIRSTCGKLGGNPSLVKQKPTTGVNQKPTPSSSVSPSSSSSEKQAGRPPDDVEPDRPPPPPDIDTQVREFIGTSPLMPVWNKGEHDALRKLVTAAGWPKARELIAAVRKDPNVVSPSKVALARLADEQARAADDSPESTAKAAMAILRERRKATA